MTNEKLSHLQGHFLDFLNIVQNIIQKIPYIHMYMYIQINI